MVRYRYDSDRRCIVSDSTGVSPVFSTKTQEEGWRQTLLTSLLNFPEPLVSIVSAFSGFGQFQIEFGPNCVVILDLYDGTVHYVGPSGSDRQALQRAGDGHFLLCNNSQSILAIKRSPSQGLGRYVMTSVGRVSAVEVLERQAGFEPGPAFVATSCPKGTFLLHFADGSFRPAFDLASSKPGKKADRAHRLWANLSAYVALLHAAAAEHGSHNDQGFSNGQSLSDSQSCLVAWGNPQTGGTLPSELQNVHDPQLVQTVVHTRSAFVALLRTGQLIPWGLPAAGGAEPEPEESFFSGLQLASVRASAVWPVTTDRYGGQGFLALCPAGPAPVLIWGSHIGFEAHGNLVSEAEGGCRWIPVPQEVLEEVTSKLEAGLTLQRPFSNKFGTVLLFSDGSAVCVLENYRPRPGFRELRKGQVEAGEEEEEEGVEEEFMEEGLEREEEEKRVIGTALSSRQIHVPDSRPSAVTRPVSSLGSLFSGFLWDRPCGFAHTFFADVKQDLERGGKSGQKRGEGGGKGGKERGEGGGQGGTRRGEGGGEKIRRMLLTEQAFGAVLSSGRLVTWGNPAFGGRGPQSARCIGDKTGEYTDIVASGKGFAAVRADGSVDSWGFETAQNRLQAPSTESSRQWRVRRLWGSADQFLFAAQMEDGNLAVWGDLETMV